MAASLVKEPVSVIDLELGGGRHYIGWTSNTEAAFARRVQEHKTGVGASAYAMKYGVIGAKRLANREKGDHEHVVIETMLLHGIDNVRGGQFSNPVLSVAQYTEATRLIAEEHKKQEQALEEIAAKKAAAEAVAAAAAAAAKKEKEKEPEKEEPINARMIAEALVLYRAVKGAHKADNDHGEEPPLTYTLKCIRCGRTSHLEPACYAKRHENGKRLEPRPKRTTLVANS